MEKIRFFIGTLAATYKATRRHIPKDSNLASYRWTVSLDIFTIIPPGGSKISKQQTQYLSEKHVIGRPAPITYNPTAPP